TTLEIKQGEKIDMSFLEEILQTYNFQLVDFVNEPGQYAIRGGNAEVIDSAGASVAAGGKFAKRKDLAVVFNTLDLNKNPFLIGVKSTRDACIVDPPRSGIGQKMRKWLQIKGPKRLIYVSCHPAALARDISALSDYKPVVFYPVDMFPNTPDVETIAIFDKKS
ncbi:MAG: hypothetical protein HN757_18225, partial [Calditrichaeota bacterium]|nr:hypothetical protein [Calditrichota bacterium]